MINNREIKIIIFVGTALTVLSAVICAFKSILCALLCFILGAALTVIFAVCTLKRYKALCALNDYLSLVCAGNYSLDIADNTEGELSILKNNLYKVISILRSQNELLEKDKRYLSDSLADISHQLKTPLTSITVMTDLLTSEKDEEKKQEFIHIINNQLDKMKWLITTLLKISKLDAGTAQLKKEPCKSTDLMKAVSKPFALMLELKNISLISDIPEFTMSIDKNWTAEALQNILKNCIEHTESGGSIALYGEDTNLYSTIRIADTGCGIDSEDLCHIFERFYHGKNSCDESVGIGLALAKTVLEKENGEISVKSTLGKGSEFEIKFYKSII